MVTINVCGMHEIGVMAEALKYSWVGMDGVGIGKYVLFHPAEGWYAESVRLKYSGTYG